MNKDRQRIAIAEACGWTEICHVDNSRKFENCSWPQSVIDGAKAYYDKRSGWTGFAPGDAERRKEQREMFARPSPMPNCAVIVPGGIVEPSQLPDYLTDLNACHEMEKVLTPEHRVAFIWALWGTDNNDLIRGSVSEVTIFDRASHATAAQRCEAFLKTLNLWEDTP